MLLPVPDEDHASPPHMLQPEEPKHWSIFYPEGIDDLDPPRFHFLYLGAWRTVHCDRYNHKRPSPTDKPGHTVKWLHTAQPRDRFVFTVEPVERLPNQKNLVFRFWTWIYGKPPAFAYSHGRMLWNDGERESCELKQDGGVVIVEVLHQHITAMDYAPWLSTTRFAIETKVATTRWFPSREAAYETYHCEDKLYRRRRGNHAAASSRNLNLSRQRDADQGSSRAPTPQPGTTSSRQASLHPPENGDEASVTPQLSSTRLASVGSATSKFDLDAIEPLPPATEPYAPDTATRHTDTMLVLFSQDPHFNAVLREVVMPPVGTHPFTASLQEQRRLLGLVEAGMPSWTVHPAKLGLPYRRSFRLVYVALVNLWPLIALGVGLYDLYKHMPFLREFMAETLAPLTSWMDNHVVLRISVLVTYLFTAMLRVVQGLMGFVKTLAATVQFLASPLYPLTLLLRLLWSVVTTVFAPLLTLLSTVGTAVHAGILAPLRYVLLGPFRLIALLFSWAPIGSSQVQAGVANASYVAMMWRSWLDFWDHVARPIKNVAKACYDGLMHLGVAIARREASIRRWYFSRTRTVAGVVDTAVATTVDVAAVNMRLLRGVVPSAGVPGIVFVLSLGILLFVVVPQMYYGAVTYAATHWVLSSAALAFAIAVVFPAATKPLRDLTPNQRFHLLAAAIAVYNVGPYAWWLWTVLVRPRSRSEYADESDDFW